MDSTELQLRDALHQTAETPWDSADDLIASVRRTRRRRVAGRAAVAIVAVAVVAAAGIVAASSIGPTRTVEPAKPVFPLPSTVDPDRIGSIESELISVGKPTQSAFIDQRTGFVVLGKCRGDSAKSTTCGLSLEITTDGGASFSPRTQPPGSLGNDDPMSLFAFDASHLVLEGAVTASAITNPAGWTSADGGRTWRPAARVDVGRATDVPADAQLIAGEPAGAGAETMLAINANGALTRITSAPPGAFPLWRTPVDGALLAANGSHWYASLDRGRTWRVSTVPLDLTQGGAEVIGATGHTLYAIYDRVPSGPGLWDQKIMISTDQGHTWRLAATPALTPVGRSGPASKDLAFEQLSVAATPTSGLIINDGARTWRMAPGSKTFVSDDQPFPIIGVTTVGQVMIAASADMRQPHPTPRLYVSGDGVHWQPVDW